MVRISKNEPKQLQAMLLAAQMLVDNDLGDWQLDIKPVTSYHGQTDFKLHKITFAKNFITVCTKEQFIHVVYHEMAHAKLGPGHGHGRKFKAMCWTLSKDLAVGWHSLLANTKKYLTHCAKCGTTASANNKITRRWCGPCMKKGVRSVLTFTPNPLEEEKWNE